MSSDREAGAPRMATGRIPGKIPTRRISAGATARMTDGQKG